MEKNKDRVKLMLMIILTGTVVLGAITWLILNLMEGDIMKAVLPAGVALTVIIFALTFVKRRYSDMKEGFAFEDERSKKILNKSAANSYYISLYWMLALMWYADLAPGSGYPELIPRHVALAGILGMALLFALNYLYVSRKEELE